jgi:ABC-2 type transport system ATP-binding protein
LVGAARLHLQRSDGLSTLFARLQVQRADGSSEILSEQVTPLGAQSEVSLAAVSGLLQPGDVLGLNISGFSDQYLFNSSWRPTTVTLQGEIELPGTQPLQPRVTSHN